MNLWAVRDTGVPTLEVTDCTDEVPVREKNTSLLFLPVLA